MSCDKCWRSRYLPLGYWTRLSKCRRNFADWYLFVTVIFSHLEIWKKCHNMALWAKKRYWRVWSTTRSRIFFVMIIFFRAWLYLLLAAILFYLCLHGALFWKVWLTHHTQLNHTHYDPPTSTTHTFKMKWVCFSFSFELVTENMLSVFGLPNSILKFDTKTEG